MGIMLRSLLAGVRNNSIEYVTNVLLFLSTIMNCPQRNTKLESYNIGKEWKYTVLRKSVEKNVKWEIYQINMFYLEYYS